MHWLPLGPRKLRYLSALFILGAVGALLTGCSAGGTGENTGSAFSGLYGLALAMRPSARIVSDPAHAQRHARQPRSTQFSSIHLPQHHPYGSN